LISAWARLIASSTREGDAATGELALEHHAQVVEGHRVEGVGHRHDEGAAVELAHGDDLPLPGEAEVEVNLLEQRDGQLGGGRQRRG
jgi:hypothetical protein